MDLGLRNQNLLITGASACWHAAAPPAGCRRRAESTSRATLRKVEALATWNCARSMRRGWCWQGDLAQAASTEAAAVANGRRARPARWPGVAAAGAAQGGLFWEIDDGPGSGISRPSCSAPSACCAPAPGRTQRSGRIVLIVGNSAKYPEPRMIPGAVANSGLGDRCGLAEESGRTASSSTRSIPGRYARRALGRADAGIAG